MAQHYDPIDGQPIKEQEAYSKVDDLYFRSLQNQTMYYQSLEKGFAIKFVGGKPQLVPREATPVWTLSGTDGFRSSHVGHYEQPGLGPGDYTFTAVGPDLHKSMTQRRLTVVLQIKSPTGSFLFSETQDLVASKPSYTFNFSLTQDLTPAVAVMEFKAHSLMKKTHVTANLTMMPIPKIRQDLINARKKSEAIKKPNEFIVELRKGVNGVGMRLALDKSRHGAIVKSVEPNGPATRANLQVGDMIMGIQGERVEGYPFKQMIPMLRNVALTVVLVMTKAPPGFVLGETGGGKVRKLEKRKKPPPLPPQPGQAPNRPARAATVAAGAPPPRPARRTKTNNDMSNRTSMRRRAPPPPTAATTGSAPAGGAAATGVAVGAAAAASAGAPPPPPRRSIPSTKLGAETQRVAAASAARTASPAPARPQSTRAAPPPPPTRRSVPPPKAAPPPPVRRSVPPPQPKAGGPPPQPPARQSSAKPVAPPPRTATPAAAAPSGDYEKYTRMKRAGLPEGAIRNAMQRDGVAIPDGFFAQDDAPAAAAPPPKPTPAATPPPPVPPARVSEAPTPAAPAAAAGSFGPEYEKYSRMQKAGLPEGAILNAMARDGVQPPPGFFQGAETAAPVAPPPRQPAASAPSGGGGLLAGIQGFNKGNLKKADEAPAPKAAAPASGGGGLLAGIQGFNRGQLKKTEDLPPPAPSSGSSGGGLLAGLQGFDRSRLRSASTPTKPEVPADRSSKGGLHNAFADAIEQRRGFIADSDSEEEWDDDDEWEM